MIASTKKMEKLRGPILRAVSRSFYLSLRLLPPALRDPISVAYLLARATDTIADTAEIAVELRGEALRNLASAIQNRTQTRRLKAVKFTENAERALIDALPDILSSLDSLPERDQIAIRNVLTKINHGQVLDLERFGSGAAMHAMASAVELDEYTYLVAGCVGEFWTRLCFEHVANFCDRANAEMRELGARYGKGLQLINILRDAGADLRAGRCYLPAEELNSLGLEPEEILRDPARIEPIQQRWREKAEQGIAAGIEYAAAVRPARIRFATVLPALIGARTLALLRAAGAEALSRKVKVPRAEVRKIISSLAVTLASRRSLLRVFRRLSE